jgi:hypothetical protein
MTPELKARIDHHTKELAAALWQLDHPEEMSNLETIEMVVRDQVLTHVGPQIALFCRRNNRNHSGTASDNNGTASDNK